ncbi:MAG: lipopolysaccharide kinase InaA family protein [Halioglobus sp.]
MNKRRVQVVRGTCPELAARLKQDNIPATDWCSQHGQTIKESQHSWVGFLQLEDTSVYVKVFRSKGLAQQFALRLGRHRALRSFTSADNLLKAQLPVPLPIACLQVGADMLLVTQRLVEGDDLLSLWEVQGEQLSAAVWRDAGVLIGQLHRAGFVHGDCKWSNMYLAHDRHHLVDLDSVARVGMGAPVQYRDVARFVLNAEDLNAPQKTVDTFLAAYAGEIGCSTGEVSAATLPLLKRLRQRHARTYGKRGQILLNG